MSLPVTTKESDIYIMWIESNSVRGHMYDPLTLTVLSGKIKGEIIKLSSNGGGSIRY